MEIVKERALANGNREVVLRLKPGEALLGVNDNSHYLLGAPVDEVVGAHVLTTLKEVRWCPLSQKWVE